MARDLRSIEDEDGLPEVLADALRRAREEGGFSSNVEAYEAGYDEDVTALCAQLPAVRVADGQATVVLGELSPGCACCKEGKWDCVFVTSRCNLGCRFCCSPRRPERGGHRSAFGLDVARIVEGYRRVGIRGVSLSGGEPFLEPERTLTLLAEIRRHLGEGYFWLYTNGVLVRREHIDCLADRGLDEIRFNTAATGYVDPVVLKIVEYAARRIPSVTVEIPLLIEDGAKLLASLASWESAGVKYLNLHELMREPHSNSFRLDGEFKRLVLRDGHVMDISTQSRRLGTGVLKAVHDARLGLGVNLCSLSSKLLQLRNRRRNMAVLCREPHQRLCGDEYLETGLAWVPGQTPAWVHPDDLERHRRTQQGIRLFVLRSMAPLSVSEQGRLVAVREVT